MLNLVGNVNSTKEFRKRKFCIVLCLTALNAIKKMCQNKGEHAMKRIRKKAP